MLVDIIRTNQGPKNGQEHKKAFLRCNPLLEAPYLRINSTGVRRLPFGVLHFPHTNWVANMVNTLVPEAQTYLSNLGHPNPRGCKIQYRALLKLPVSHSKRKIAIT